MSKLPTAYFGRCTEGCSHLRIHRYVKILVLSNFSISFLDTCSHPSAEYALEDSCTDITNPLFGYFMDFLSIRHILKNLLMTIVQERAYVLQGETIILWYRDMAYIFCFDAYSIHSQWLEV